jgi:hypothetical protein
LKLKLGKASWFILVVGIFIVILAGLGLTRSKQLQEKSQLDEELSKAEMRLSNLQVKQLGQQRDELQEKLDESTRKLTEAKDSLSQDIESIDVSDEFFAVASSCGVVINSISSSVIKKEKLDNMSCSEIMINATASGEVNNLVNFVIQLNNTFTTGVVKTAQISIPEADSEHEPSVNVMMVVYSYEGD